MNGRQVSHIAVTLGVVLLLAACSPQHSSPPGPDPERSNIIWPLRLHPFGTIMEFSDGLAMKVEPMREGLATKHADGASRNSNVLMFLMTITNGTPETYNPNCAHVEMEYAGLLAPQVFDSSHPLFASADGSFEKRIEPGEVGTAEWLFAIPKEEMQDMRVLVTLDQERSPSHFSGGFTPEGSVRSTDNDVAK
jgi:hypothetical protein